MRIDIAIRQVCSLWNISRSLKQKRKDKDLPKPISADCMCSTHFHTDSSILPDWGLVALLRDMDGSAVQSGTNSQGKKIEDFPYKMSRSGLLVVRGSTSSTIGIILYIFRIYALRSIYHRSLRTIWRYLIFPYSGPNVWFHRPDLRTTNTSSAAAVTPNLR